MHVAITGASSGIGEALAREYFERGACVTLVARREDRLHEVARAAPGKTHVVRADLSDIDHACEWVASAEHRLGPIDVLVNNAGASMVHSTTQADWSAVETLMRLNVLAPFRLTCTLAPRMVQRGRGCIVDIASVAALAPAPYFYFYNASKAALAAASESLRAELRPSGVHIVTVYPGPVDTAMARANFDVFNQKLARRTPTGDSRVLARRIARAVERKHARVIYPRVYAVTRWLPGLARWGADRTLPPLERPRTKLAFDPSG